MIITVTMNPAIDKTVDIDTLEKGTINRIENVLYDAGGKGINVSKAIKELGGTSIATGFLGLNGSEMITKCLVENGIATSFVMVDGDTRTNLKIVEKMGPVTEFNEPGPVIEEINIEQMENKLLKYANEETIFVLAGSVPRGVPKSIYKEIIEKVVAKGAKVLLDAEGELFAEAIEAVPQIVKPNREELEAYFKCDHTATEDEIVVMGKCLINKGIGMVVISLGADGAIMLVGNDVYKCESIDVKKHSTVGAGDAMVGAIAYGIDKNLSLEDILRLSVATSTGAVTTLGTKPPVRAVVDELLLHMKAQQIG